MWNIVLLNNYLTKNRIKMKDRKQGIFFLNYWCFSFFPTHLSATKFMKFTTVSCIDLKQSFKIWKYINFISFILCIHWVSFKTSRKFLSGNVKQIKLHESLFQIKCLVDLSNLNCGLLYRISMNCNKISFCMLRSHLKENNQAI